MIAPSLFTTSLLFVILVALPLPVSAIQQGNQSIMQVLQDTETNISLEETPVFGNFTFFTNLLQLTGVNTTFQDGGEYTVFAPTDAAFSQTSFSFRDSLRRNATTGGEVNSTAFVLYYIVNGSYTVESLTKITALTNLEGDTLAVNATESGVKVNNASIVIPDLQADNGVIQGIGTVLSPPGFIVNTSFPYNGTPLPR